MNAGRKLFMSTYFIIPGLGNSGPEHWQTWFESQGPDFTRIQQREWDAPDLEDWLANIDKALEGQDLSQVILIGHSLGCATIAHWAKRSGKLIKGALLVAPSDLEAPVYTFPAAGFTPIPLERIPFPTIVVASTDDVWVSLERAMFFANSWGSSFVNIGAAGHINAVSGHHQWAEGLEILKRLG
jgi:predicted alpha/beta hydrolase family esterase